MTPAPLTLSPHLAQRIPAETAARFFAVGNAALLAEPLLGFIASRQCPGHILLETLERVPQWAQQNRVLVSGFHSPLEQQVLKSLLRRQDRAVKLLARSFAVSYRPTPEERPALGGNRLLVLSVSPHTPRITRASALARNQLVLALAGDTCIPYLSPGSSLAAMSAGPLTIPPRPHAG